MAVGMGVVPARGHDAMMTPQELRAAVDGMSRQLAAGVLRVSPVYLRKMIAGERNITPEVEAKVRAFTTPEPDHQDLGEERDPYPEWSSEPEPEPEREIVMRTPESPYETLARNRVMLLRQVLIRDVSSVFTKNEQSLRSEVLLNRFVKKFHGNKFEGETITPKTLPRLLGIAERRDGTIHMADLVLAHQTAVVKPFVTSVSQDFIDRAFEAAQGEDRLPKYVL